MLDKTKKYTCNELGGVEIYWDNEHEYWAGRTSSGICEKANTWMTTLLNSKSVRETEVKSLPYGIKTAEDLLGCIESASRNLRALLGIK